MKLGFAVKVLGDGGLPSHDTRRWQSEPHLRVSLGHLARIFDYLERVEIGMYRMATALAPYASHPQMPKMRRQVEECAAELESAGLRARRLGLRLSTHPGQYSVLNSENPAVMAAAAEEVEVQAELLDAMGLGPEAVVLLHVGGLGGGIIAGMDRFCKGYEMLSERARARLVIENDDRTYGLAEAVEISSRTGCPVVWDILHHHCNDAHGISDREALSMALATWPPEVKPKIHFSSPRTDMTERKRKVGRKTETIPVLPQLRAHADLVDPISFEQFLLTTARGLDFDVMLEAKGKDLALLRLREHLRARKIDIQKSPAPAEPQETTASGTERA